MNLFPLKFLFWVATLSIAAFAQNSDSTIAFERFAESIKQNSLRGISAEHIFIFVAIVILFIVAVVFYEIYRTNRIKRELLSLAWETFDFKAEALNLNKSNLDMLKEIVQEANLQDPSSMLKSPQVFEHSLEKYYQIKRIESMSNGDLVKIRGLRKALGFLPLSVDIAFNSTRQFSNGEKCIVQIPESGKATHKGMCIVNRVEERQWSITRPNGPPVPEKTGIFLSLTRPGDAEYTFTVQILKDLNGELVLTHTEKLNREQQRNWVRIDVSIPVEVTQIDNNRIGDIFQGKIIDMSGGGFSMALPVKLINGSKLLLNFELPGHGSIKDLPVKVVRVAGMHNNDPSVTAHSVAFDGDLHLIQEQIIQYVFEKQRQNSLLRQT